MWAEILSQVQKTTSNSWCDTSEAVWCQTRQLHSWKRITCQSAALCLPCQWSCHKGTMALEIGGYVPMCIRLCMALSSARYRKDAVMHRCIPTKEFLAFGQCGIDGWATGCCLPWGGSQSFQMESLSSYSWVWSHLLTKLWTLWDRGHQLIGLI